MSLGVEEAFDFEYRDPVDGSTSSGQGYCFHLKSGARIVYRFSGTGTGGATLRVYIEQWLPPQANVDDDPQTVLEPLIRLSRMLPSVTGDFLGQPTTIT